MAQHTSRQRVHLLGCQQYLDAMKEQGVETSITRQAANPQAFFKGADWQAKPADPKVPKVHKMQEHTTAVRVQALALAEVSISYERIQEITGMEPRVLAGLRRLARERGYDPAISMQIKEEYVLDPPSNGRPRGRPKKRKPDDDVDPALTGLQEPAQSSPNFNAPRNDNLPPGQWNFMTPPAHGYTMT